MPAKALTVGSILLAYNAIGTRASLAAYGGGSGDLNVNLGGGGGLNGGVGGGAQGNAGLGLGGGIGGGVSGAGGAGIGGGAGADLDAGGSGGLSGNGGAGANIGAGAGLNAGGNAGVGASGSSVGSVGGQAGVNGGGKAGLNVGGGSSGTGGVAGGAAVNGGGNAANNVGGGAAVGGGGAGAGVSAGGVSGSIGGLHGEISWPDLQVGIAPGGDNAAPVYTPAASIWSQPASNVDHKGDHKIAPGVFLTASATQDIPAPQYTIQGGPAKLYYFPSNVGEGAPAASITPAPGTESSPVGGGAGLGADGLLTTMDKTFNPKYVYVSFSTLFAGCKVGDEMKTIGPNYANTMFSFHSDEISTRCASTMAPDATPSYGPPAAVNWDDLNASGDSSCWNLAPPAEFLKVVPPEWTQQLYWNMKFDPPQLLLEKNAAAQPTMPANNAEADAVGATPASGAAAETPVATSGCTSCSGAAATGGVAAGTGSVYGPSNGSSNGSSPVPYTGGSNPHHGHGGHGGWRMVAVGMLVGVVTVITLL